MTERISYVEIDLTRCALEYGVAPCTASIPTTGAEKCFNCLATCQDRDTYLEPSNNAQETVTSRHSTASGTLPIDIDAIPDLAAVSIRPAQLDLGESIGVRASVTLTFKDARYPDTGPEGDRYLSDRNYDPFTQGSYWGKFRARYPFTQGADIRLIRGSSDQSLAQMETRHFIVDNVSGPDSKGTFTIVCKDALKLADSKRAQSPVLSQGELSATLPISGPSAITLLPAGIGASYPDGGYLNIGGEEIIAFSNLAGTDTFQISGRGSFNTTAQEHDAGSRVQLCNNYEATDSLRVSDIIKDLLVTYAQVPSEYIPIGDWNNEDDTYIKRTYSAIIPEPESVTSLVNELLQQTASTIWWDDVNKLMQFRVLKDVSTDAALYDDNLILADSFSAKDQNSKRVSQVWTYFGQINPLENLTDRKNYSRTQANIDPESEANFEGVPSIRRIFSRWITAESRPTAENLNLTILSRYSTPPRLVSYALQRDVNLTVPQLSGGYNVRNRNTQTATGAAEIVPIQVTQLKSSDTGFTVIGEEVIYSQTITPTDPQEKAVPLESDENSISLYDKAILSNNAAPEAGDTWTFSISTGTIIGSNSTAGPAITTGTEWPAGVTLILINFGSVVGKGGAGAAGGGDNGVGNNGIGFVGLAGGDAISADYDLSVTNNGIIGGGGGGGGGGGADAVLVIGNPNALIGGGGGGGGTGFTSSLGGVGGTKRDAVGISGDDGSSGGSSTELEAGIGGDGGSIIFGGTDYVGGKGGAGGDLGANGISGNSGLTAFGSAGGIGGTAGAAINKNGYTVTVTGNTPLGVVNP